MSGRRALAFVALGAAGFVGTLFVLVDLARERALRPFCHLAVPAFAAGSPGAAALGDGLAAALAAQLSGIRGVDAAGPAELALAGPGGGPFTLRLAGRLLAAEPRLEIEMRWIDGRSGRTLRARRLAVARERIFDLQERLARETAALCGIRPSFAERRALARGLASSLPAYELYLRARALLDGAGTGGRPAPPDYDAAARLLRQATAADSELALAHAALAEALLGEGRAAAALDEAELARELDDHLPAIHLTLVRADRAAGRPRAARIELLRLLSLRPEVAAARRELRRSAAPPAG